MGGPRPCPVPLDRFARRRVQRFRAPRTRSPVNSTLVNGVRRSAGIGAEFVEDTPWVPFIASARPSTAGQEPGLGAQLWARHDMCFHAHVLVIAFDTNVISLRRQDAG